MDETSTNMEENVAAADPETPEDVAVLYTWANVHGGKYRDFSASRREFRAQQRHRLAEMQRQAELEAARAKEEEAARELEEARIAEDEAENDEVLKSEAEEARRRAEEKAEQDRLDAQRHVEVAEELKRSVEQAQREMEEARQHAEEQAARWREADAQLRAQQRDAEQVPGEIADPYYFAGPLEPTAFAPGRGVRSSLPQRVSSERRIMENYYRTLEESRPADTQRQLAQSDSGMGIFSSARQEGGGSGSRPFYEERSIYRERGSEHPQQDDRPTERVIPHTELAEDTRERNREDERERGPGVHVSSESRFDDNADDAYYDRMPRDYGDAPSTGRNTALPDLHIPPRTQQTRTGQSSSGERRITRSEDPQPGNVHQHSSSGRTARREPVEDVAARTARRPRQVEPQRQNEGFGERARRIGAGGEPAASPATVQREAAGQKEPAVERNAPQRDATDRPTPEFFRRPVERTPAEPERRRGFEASPEARPEAAPNERPAAGTSSDFQRLVEARENRAARPEWLFRSSPAAESRPESPSEFQRSVASGPEPARAAAPGAAKPRTESRNPEPAPDRFEDRTREIRTSPVERPSQTIPAADGSVNLRPLLDRPPLRDLPALRDLPLRSSSSKDAPAREAKPEGTSNPQTRPAASPRAEVQPNEPSPLRARPEEKTKVEPEPAWVRQERPERRRYERAGANPERNSPRYDLGTPPIPASSAPAPVERGRAESPSASAGDPKPAGTRDERREASLSGRSSAASMRTSVPPSVRPNPATADTLQQSRERVAARWFALKGLMGNSTGDSGAETPVAQARPRESTAPILAVVSLSGGVGKTSLVATVGRCLSSLGEKVLIADTSVHGLLPYYFGARELRPDVLRTFSPPAGSTDAPVYMVNYDVSRLGNDDSGQVQLVEEIGRHARGTQRVLLDLNASSIWLARRLARQSSTILVPIAPDMNSVLGIQAVERYFAGGADPDGRSVQPFYVLNQFDASLPLHLDVREVLRQQLGDRLLTVMIRRSPSVSEALAEGMTVIDYVPDSPVTEDYVHLAEWVRSLAAPAAAAGLRSIRWSER